MNWRRPTLPPSFGPEWNVVLGVLAVLAVLILLAMLRWWLGVLALAGLLAGLAVTFWRGA